MALAAGLVAAADGRTIQVPEDAATIQGAVDLAGPGDRVVVGPGTWREAVRIDGRGLVLESKSGPSRTLIDGSGLSSSVLTVTGSRADSVVIRGFRVAGGVGDADRFGPSATIGGGLLVKGASPLIENCRFSGNVVTYEGGGAWIGGRAAARFVNCSFTSNRAERGGGAYVHDSKATFVDCRFMSCIALFAGGGIVADAASEVTVSDSTFEECTAAHNGGGIYVYQSGATVERSTFLRNSAGRSGGAIYQGYNAQVEQVDLDFRTFGDSVFGQWYSSLAGPPKGACCIESVCIEVTERACHDAGGRWSGADTDCVSVLAAACPIATPGDLNDDAAVDILDVAILMSLWGEDPPAPATEP
jgi:hypothetical protein